MKKTLNNVGRISSFTNISPTRDHLPISPHCTTCSSQEKFAFDVSNAFIYDLWKTESAVKATIRASFGYGGQKCSACARLYVPESLWEQVMFYFMFYP